jgi:hypothetical protein
VVLEMNKIKFLSVVGLICILPMLVYYPYEAISWQLEISFLDWDRWSRGSAWVDEGAQIPLSTRIVFFVIWFVPTVFGWLAYVAGASLLWLLRAGVVFDHRIAQRLVWMGVLSASSASGSMLAGAVSPMVRSWHNAAGPLPLRFWYSSGNIGLAFSGLAFLFLGLVLHEAIKIARENEEFV